MAVITVSNTGGNWTNTSTWIGAVVPTAADDVVFTATSGNLTVDTNVANCKSINFTNYINTITINNNAVLNVYGNVTLNTAHTNVCVGTGRMAIQATSSLTSNTKAWSGALYFVNTSANKTFVDAWDIGTFGLTDISSVTTLNANITVGNFILNNNNSLANSLVGFKIIVNGNFTEGTNIVKLGTTEIVLSGTGTWSNSSTGALRLPVTINTAGTITISGNIYYNTGTLTYTAGTVTTTGSTLNIGASTTLNTNGIIWNNITLSGASQTFTLSSNLTIIGTLTLSGTGNNVFSGSIINLSGNLTLTNTGLYFGTSSLLYNGTGTWSHTGTGYFGLDFTINTTGTLTLGTNIYYGGVTGKTLKWISGTVISTGNTLSLLGSSTAVATNVNLDTSGIIFNNITATSGTYSTTVNLISDLYFSGTLVNGSPTVQSIINGSNIYCMSGRLDLFGNGSGLNGSSVIYLKGKPSFYTLYSGADFNMKVIIDCEIVTLSSTGYQNATTIQYVRGKFNKTDLLRTVQNAVLINFHKAPIYNVAIRTSVTMNEFFSGSPNRIVNINPGSGTSYTITFQDTFEKIAKFVNISGATISRRNQLLVITNSKKSSTNSGIRYINSLPNGIAKGDPSVQNTMTPGLGTFLVGDPTIN